VCSQAKDYDVAYRTSEQRRKDFDKEYSSRSKLFFANYRGDGVFANRGLFIKGYQE
jgi:hypothetical protein